MATALAFRPRVGALVDELEVRDEVPPDNRNNAGTTPPVGCAGAWPGDLLTPMRQARILTHMDEYNDPRLDSLFGAMSDATRRAILARLAQSDARVTELASAFTISLNSTSKHIRVLERAGLVTRSVQGRDHVLSLNAGPMAEAAGWLEFYRQFWTDRLAALETFVIKKRHLGKQGSKQ
ncbi:MAG TPA: helix-turn-helix transcriptional regulator [Rhodanobacter sp.]|nr:helix-turn-helix transcriptional regulator [Rhodanobacter sp.]